MRDVAGRLDVVKLLGAGYLIYLGIRAILARQPTFAPDNHGRAPPARTRPHAPPPPPRAPGAAARAAPLSARTPPAAGRSRWRPSASRRRPSSSEHVPRQIFVADDVGEHAIDVRLVEGEGLHQGGELAQRLVGFREIVREKIPGLAQSIVTVKSLGYRLARSPDS